jgi:hypothetical protein
VSVPGWRWLPVNAFFFIAHIIMQRKQLLTLKGRAETQGATTSPQTPHAMD